MDSFSLLSDVTLGQYLPGRSVVHRLDPRTKLVAFVLLVWAISSVGTYLGTAFVIASAFGLIAVARLPVGYVMRGFRPILPILVIFLIFQILFGGNADLSGSTVLWTWSAPDPLPIRFTITEASLRAAAVSIGRLVCLLILTSVLTLTTTTTGLTHGLELLLAPLRPLKVPGHELAMTLAIALRFVPTLAEELERIVKAQVSRGADFDRPGRLAFLRRTRQLVPIVVPLFVSTFRRAEELVLAMEARGYVGGAGRSRLAPLRATRLDWYSLPVVVLYALAVYVVRPPL
jgi:energy-coupling factor transport system permease protein